MPDDSITALKTLQQLRKQVRAFAASEVLPHVQAMEASTLVQRELSRLIAAQGWLGVTIDPAYGGMGLGHLAKTVILDELSRVSPAMGAMLQASQLGMAKIQHFGTEDQKQTWLPPIARGDLLPTIAVTEAGSGSHVLGMTTTAVRDGDDYVLTGRKVFVGNSHVGDIHGVVARLRPGKEGLCAFLVESDNPGLSLEPHRPALGLHGFSFGELVLSGCRVPVSHRIGEENDGLAVAYSSSILYGRPNLAAVALGIHHALVAATIRHVDQRYLYGKPLRALPTIRDQIGQMASDLKSASLALYHATGMLDRGVPCDSDLIHAKLVNTQLVQDSASAAMRIFAARGLLPSSPIERYFRDAQHIEPPAGTAAIQRLRLAEIALGESKRRRQWSQRFPQYFPRFADAYHTAFDEPDITTPDAS